MDFISARVVSDARFDVPGMGDVFADRAVRATDGRLVLADHRSRVFVVYADQPDKPDDRDVTLTALGARS